MNEWIFLACIFVLAAWLSRFTINPTIFNYIKWGLFISTAILSLIILNSDTVAAWFSQGAQILEAQGIGHPRSWKIRSKYDDDVISACYYLTFFSAWACVLVTTMYEGQRENESRKLNISREQVLLVSWAAALLLGWILYDIFFGGGYFGSGPGNRLLRAFYKSQIGLLAHEFATINVIAVVFGAMIRVIFRKTNT